jgi:hypothetical protein
MNSLNVQQLTAAKKIEIEKRKRHQLYNTLDYVLSNTTYFDFFSKDCFSVIKNAKIFAYLFSRSKLTTDLLLLSFFETDSKIKKILMEYGINKEKIKELILTKEEIDLKADNNLFFSFFNRFENKQSNEDKINDILEISFSPELSKLFEKTAENAMTRFKTPVINSDILFITLMEDQASKVSKIIRKSLNQESDWYILRYRLLKELHLHESTIRGEVTMNYQYFAYLLKTRLSDNEFDQLIKKEILDSGVLLFRNYLIQNLLKINLFERLSIEILKSNKITNKRKYLS